MTEYRSSAPKNAFQTNLQNTSSAATSPVEEQDRISYGIIEEVNANSRVKVKMFRPKSQGGDIVIASGKYLSLLQPLNVIHMLYGPLRPKLKVRIFWKGKLVPQGKNIIIEVIGAESDNLAVKEPEIAALDQKPYKVFSGGTIPV